MAELSRGKRVEEEKRILLLENFEGLYPKISASGVSDGARIDRIADFVFEGKAALQLKLGADIDSDITLYFPGINTNKKMVQIECVMAWLLIPSAPYFQIGFMDKQRTEDTQYIIRHFPNTGEIQYRYDAAVWISAGMPTIKIQEREWMRIAFTVDRYAHRIRTVEFGGEAMDINKEVAVAPAIFPSTYLTGEIMLSNQSAGGAATAVIDQITIKEI
jgi:hypothetical protein